MSRRATFGVSGAVGLGLLAAVAIALALVVFPSRGQSVVSPAPGGLFRVASAFSVDESYTTTTQTLWSKSFPISNNYKWAYVTVTGQSDVHSSAQELLGCQLDGINCSPSEWITVQNVGANDWHDNSVTARWCAKLNPGPGTNTTHTVNVYQQSSNGGDVFIESVLITVDVTSNVFDCQEFPSVSSGGGGAPTNGGHTHHG